MKETIILVPSVNSAEMTRSFARYGKRQIGYRFMSGVELARYALQLCGKSVNRTFLPRNEAAAVIYAFLPEIPYFQSASFADAVNLVSSLDSVRSLICDDESGTMKRALADGEFPDKNDALLDAYNRYQASLEEQHCVDWIGLIRMAIESAQPFDADFCFFSEFALSPIEQKLLDTLSNGQAQMHSLCAFLDKAEQTVRIHAYTDSYGTANEVEHILGAICRTNTPLDHCTVAITNVTEYAQLFYEASVRHQLPVTFGCGVPILNANPARLLKALAAWDSVGNHGVDALRQVIFSDAFDRKKLMQFLQIEQKKELDQLVETAGILRISYDNNCNFQRLRNYQQTLTEQEITGFFPKLTRFADEMAKGYVSLVETYSVIRSDFAGRIDRSAVKVIVEALEAYTKHARQPIGAIIPDILLKTVCSENSREGSLHVTGIEGALSSLREHLYVAGLSASLFPGSPKENYLILDHDYALFPNEPQAPISWRKPAMKKQALLNLLQVSAALGIQIELSYSSFSASELKTQNPSSVLFEIYQVEHGLNADIDKFEKGFNHVGYFSEAMGQSNGFGRAFIDGSKTEIQLPAALTAATWRRQENTFSPTAIETFVACPMKFYLNRILGIQMPEEDTPFRVISPLEVGILAHQLMAKLAERSWTKAAFRAEASRLFDTFLLAHPPLHEDSAEDARADFVAMMLKAYDCDPHHTVIAAEEQTSVSHPSGITLKGIPDRIERTKEGEYIIVDFKTGSHIRHKDHDLDSCIQTVLYAYMIEQQGLPIARCEYRYLRFGQTVVCAYNDAIKAKMNEKLHELKTALDRCQFDYAENCQYCAYAGICDKPRQPGEVSEDV